ncbi:MAG: hypothetical protein QXN37_02415 [Candidatus Anstonellaceae archaeon]
MLPCSEVHWKILPAISRHVAVAMEKEGISRSEIARLLGTTEAAISQYINRKRGTAKISDAVKQACIRLARKAAKGKMNPSAVDLELAKIVGLAKKLRKTSKNLCLFCVKW